jgi:Flp pilus assembly protein TadD
MKREPDRQSYYHDLGIRPGASRKGIERAFWLWQERCRLSHIPSDASRRAEEAYLTLSDPRRRRDYDRRLGCEEHPAWKKVSRGTARVFFRQGLHMMKRRRHTRALDFVRRSVTLDPYNALYLSYLGLLTARTGGCLRKATRCAQEAFERSPSEARIADNLASTLELAGMPKRARKIRRGSRRSLLSLLSRRF